MTTPLLEVEGLTTGYGASQILTDVSVEVYPGELIAIIGSNGAGKTTLMRSIVGQVRAWNGAIRFDGEDITRARPEQIVGRGIALCPEGRHVFPSLTVKENLEVGAFLNSHAELKEGLERMFRWFPRLSERANQQAGTLSGGEQQMLAIARALMSRPRLLLLDEPSLGLAPVIVDQVIEVVRSIADEGITTILVEQNAQLALSEVERAYVLETGNLVKTGTGSELLADEEVRTAYLGV